MSLNFVSTNRVDVGAGTSLDNVTAGTCLVWAKTTNVGGSNQILYRKGAAVGDIYRFSFTGTTLSAVVTRATTNLEAAALHANCNGLAANTWVCFCATWNTAGVNGDQKLFTGTLTSLLAEPSAYSTQAVGSGTAGNNAADSMFIGSTSTGSQPWLGDIAVFQYVNRQMTLGEARAWQFRPSWVSGTVGMWVLGWNGTTNVPDLSGNANTGTITGATVSAHVPLGNWNDAAPGHLPYVVAAGAGSTSSWPDRRRRAVAVYRHYLQG